MTHRRHLSAVDVVNSQILIKVTKSSMTPAEDIFVRNAWAKLDEYYNLTNDSPVYVATLVLHPDHKWKYIDER